MMRTVMLAFLGLLWVAGASANETPGVKSVTIQEVAEHVEHKNAILVDARSEKDYAKEHIPGAISVPLESDASLIQAALPDKHAAIVVYCGSELCLLGPDLAKKLVSLGYTNVGECAQGFKGWKEHHKI